MSEAPKVASAALSSAEPRFVAPELVEVDAAGTPHLVGGRCTPCRALSFPRAIVCSECLGQDISKAQLAREGVLYSYSVVHAAPRGWTVPYVLGYVDLADGIRVLAHIEGAREAVRIDAKLRLGTGRVGTDPTGAPLMSYVFIPLEAERQ